MTDKEKIKTFIIWQDLEIKGTLQKLNVDGVAVLMHLRDVCKGWEGKEILKLVDKLDSEEYELKSENDRLKEENERLRKRPEMVYAEMTERLKAEVAIEKRMGREKAEKVRKETAKEILQEIYNEIDYYSCQPAIEQLAKRYGVEVEE